ncbi:MAG: ribonuclease BN [Bacteroidetes bacterium OLB12]|nr:MAG: ribonuclease BN [Bacteroidetes bacterium OLB12]
MMALMRAFNACYRTVERRNVLRMRLTATGLTFMLAMSLLLAVVLLIGGQLLLDYMMAHLSEFSHVDLSNIKLLFLVRFVVIFLVFFIGISFIYYFGPAVHYNWRFFFDWIIPGHPRHAGSFIWVFVLHYQLWKLQ